MSSFLKLMKMAISSELASIYTSELGSTLLFEIIFIKLCRKRMKTAVDNNTAIVYECNAIITRIVNAPVIADFETPWCKMQAVGVV